jgi:RNA polymerase sigma factor (sigma-70 family)
LPNPEPLSPNPCAAEPAMPSDPVFCDLIRRARAGNSDAAGELVRLYEPEIRRYIRVRLTDPQLRRAVDSADIFQSVLANFFVRLVGGQFDLHEPAQLVKLLAVMAKHRIIDHARKPANRCAQQADSAFWAAVAGREPEPGPAPDRVDLLAEFRRRLTAEEFALVEQRAAGRTWSEIAAATGASADSVRKRLDRALERVCQELGIANGDKR